MKNSAEEKPAAVGSSKAARASAWHDRASAPELLLGLQQSAGNQAMLGLLSGDTVLQRKAKGDEAETSAIEGSQSETNQKPIAAGAALIVEDDAQELKPGQMRKSDFLAQLRTAATSAAETALAGTMWSAMGCPYIDRWLDHYSKQPSAHVERALRRYVPEAAHVHSAAEYIPLVQQRLRRGIEEWRSTGEVKDLPPEFAAGGMPGATAGGLIGSLLGGAVSAIGGAISSAVSGIGNALSSVGSMLFKRHEGAEAEPAEDPAVIREQLGGGHALDGATQRRMQSAFGVDFAGVRVHTDTRARALTEDMQARAFTIGNDIAFGAEEYQPGTPVGDALIAHELAHVVQQGSGNAASGAQHKGGDSSSLEEDADRSAVGAVVKLWSGARGELSQLGRQAMPRMRSGLRLQGCNFDPPKQAGQQMGLNTLWTAESLMQIFYSKGDEHVVKTIIDQGIPVYSFESAFDTWLMPDGSKTEEEVWTLQGSQDPKTNEIYLPEGLTTEQAATALFHEVAHAQRPKTQDQQEQEIEVRIATEEFNIKHGFPPFEKEYRNSDGTINKDAIRRDVTSSGHYNRRGPTRKWLSRRYVGKKKISGWKLP